MKKLTCILFLIVCFSSFAQINYEQGYFIGNNGIKKEVYIKNIAWKNNPTEIEFKSSVDGKSEKLDISEIKEFSVSDSYKFKRFATSVDISSNDAGKLSESASPDWKKQVVMLKLLVEGKINLYQYENGNLVRYFISTGNHETAEQLIYRQYIIEATQIKTDFSFRNQLYTLMKSENFNASKFRKVRYSKDNLTALFVSFNQTKTENISDYTKKQNKSSFNLKAVAGINMTSADFSNLVNDVTFEFDSKAVFKMGIEAEAILPFNNNKWSLFVQPNFQHYEAEGKRLAVKTEIDYKFIEVPIGARHYFFLNQKSKLFIDAGYSLSFTKNSNMKYGSAETPVVKSSNYFVGVGFDYNKIGIEARYGFDRGLTKHTLFVGDHKTIGLALRYKFF